MAVTFSLAWLLFCRGHVVVFECCSVSCLLLLLLLLLLSMQFPYVTWRWQLKSPVLRMQRYQIFSPFKSGWGRNNFTGNACFEKFRLSHLYYLLSCSNSSAHWHSRFNEHLNPKTHHFSGGGAWPRYMLYGLNVSSPNILRTVRRTMVRFLTERLVRRTWFGQFDELYFVLNWLVLRCKLRPELVADAQQRAWSKM